MHDWQQFQTANEEMPEVVDPRRRLWICLAAFAVAMLVVFARTVQLEIAYGAGFRADALRPVEKHTPTPATRGRILARDGTPLAANRATHSVAVAYRWLQNPADEQWLRRTVRARMPKKDRKNAAKFAAERQKLLDERAAFCERLARCCRMSPEQWNAAVERIQDRVERIAADVYRRQSAMSAAEKSNDASWWSRLARWLTHAPPPPRKEIAEQCEYHIVADDMPAEVVAEIRGYADRWPNVKIVERTRRYYPQKTLAAHWIGHLAPESPDGEPKGRSGVERQLDDVLQGRPGESVSLSNHSGRVVKTYASRQVTPGRDITLALDVVLQRTAEELLESALERNAFHAAGDSLAPSKLGGVIIAMDAFDGSILAAASLPTFDPNMLGRRNSKEKKTPPADRVQLPPNRLTQLRIALDPFFQPIASAILDVESKPDEEKVESASKSKRNSHGVSPVELLRMTAIVANGGRLISPTPTLDGSNGWKSGDGAKLISSGETIQSMQKNLLHEIQSPDGIGHDVLTMETLAIAGKFGACERKGDSPGLVVWFAGYAPADRPKIVMVVALECPGEAPSQESAAALAGPVAKRLAIRLEQLGLLGE